jgi:tRNA pseudouridine55 synthase
LGSARQRQGRKKGRPVNGILVLDKPRGLSSNQALQRVKWLYRARKAGHTGSLDPLATGVLPLCFGEATKLSQFLLDSDKRYEVLIELGVRTNTGDAEGEITQSEAQVAVTEEQVQKALTQFIGTIEQVPPMFSAIKQQGVPLYKLAREGKEVERAGREITIYSIGLLGLDGRELQLDVHCSKGTYIRTLADDLGNLLGCGAHVKALRRTQAGAFRECDSVTLEQLEESLQGRDEEDFSGIDSFLVPMDRAVSDLPEVTLPEVTAGWIKQGQPVLVRHLPAEGLVRLYQGEQFIGIGSILDDGRVAPKRLLVPEETDQ